jgi:hypothetical protein
VGHWYFIVPIAAASYLVAIALGYFLGLIHSRLLERVNVLLGRVEDIENELEEEDDTAIIETTPQSIEKKRRSGQLPENDEESAIVTVKTPRQLAQEKAEREKAELDEIQGHSSRIG